MGKRWRCAVCRDWCEEHRHRVRPNDLPILRDKHCIDVELQSSLKIDSVVCCRHFEFHSHDSHSRKQLQVKTEFCTPTFLDSIECAFIDQPKQKKRKQKTRLKKIQEAKTKVIPSPSPIKRVTRSDSNNLKPWNSWVPNDVHNPFDLFQILSTIDVNDDSIQIPLSSVKSLLVSTLAKSIEALKLTYFSFKMQCRVDLVFWTGISTILELDSIFIIPLLDFYTSKTDHSELPKSIIPLEDRVLWVLIFLWSGMSFQCLFNYLCSSQSCPLKTLNTFIEMLRNTARDLAEALAPQISFPSFSEWIQMNKSKSSEKYQNEKKLIFILDGTSLPIFKPTSHFGSNRGWWVNYKKHHAWRFFICVTMSGEIVWVSKLFMGNESDHILYSASGLREILKEVYPKENWGDWQLALGGDKGYVFIIPPDDWELILTKSAEKEKEESEQTQLPTDGDPQEKLRYTRILDSEFAISRSVVERTIRLIKRWRKLTNGSIYLKSGDLFYHHLIIIACVYANLVICEKIKDESFENEISLN
jgi:hypothetical protein